jgi:hypothetical protein
MEYFTRFTDLGNEHVIKKGPKLPADAVNLGWYSTDDVTPENFLSIVDASNLVEENGGKLKAVSDDFIMYADEFGVLRYAKNNSELHQVQHSPIVKNPEVSLSNLVIHEDFDLIRPDGTYTLEDFETFKFAHSVYVSRYFTMISRNSCNLYWDRNFSSS